MILFDLMWVSCFIVENEYVIIGIMFVWIVKVFLDMIVIRRGKVEDVFGARGCAFVY